MPPPKVLVIAILACATTNACATSRGNAPPAATPRAADVETIDGIMRAFYEVVSGGVGEPRQWDRDRTLWLPGARLIPTSEDSTGTPHATVLDHAGFIERSDEFLIREGFTEREIHRVTRQFGDIAHVFSTYEWKTAAGETGRGVNSLELFNDGRRWWIAGAIWDQETPQDPIPPELLP